MVAARGPGATPWVAIIVVTAGTTVFTVMQGLTYPLLALILSRSGASSWVVGLNASMVPLGMLVAGPAAAQLVQSFGGYRLAVASLVGSGLAFLAIRLVGAPVAWLGIRFVIGFLVTCLFVATDTWVQQLAPDRVRGRVMGLYSALLSAGLAVGPLVLLVAGTRGWEPFLIGACFPAVAVVLLVLVRRRLPKVRHEQGASMRTFARAAPLLLVSVAVVAFADQGALTLLPLYVLGHGLSVHAASVALVVMIAGSVALLYPIGWLADRHRRSLVTVGCAAATAGLSLFLLVAVQSRLALLVVLFMLGGAYFGVYTLALVTLGERHEGAALVAGNASFGAVWGAGGLIGAPVIGGAMSVLGPSGFPVTFAAIFGLLAVALASSRGGPRLASGRRPARSRGKQVSSFAGSAAQGRGDDARDQDRIEWIEHRPLRRRLRSSSGDMRRGPRISSRSSVPQGEVGLRGIRQQMRTAAC